MISFYLDSYTHRCIESPDELQQVFLSPYCRNKYVQKIKEREHFFKVDIILDREFYTWIENDITCG